MTVPLVFQSPRMHQLVRQLQRFARSSASVLLLGESGTGKELLARSLHAESRRSRAPFIPVNCAALPAELVESELFGHETGAFTGATARRLGRFETAQGGTLFLDEVGELPMAAQPKLLRALEQGEIQRVGAAGPLPVDVRLVSATNRNLTGGVRDGDFRADLLHRLGVLSVQVPPLRDRREDIPALVQHFIKQFRSEGTEPVDGVSTEVMRQLTTHAWPGNVRELRNVIWRACILADTDRIREVELTGADEDTMDSNNLPAGYQSLSLREIEQHVIIERLRLFDGNRSRTAATLGVTTRTLRNKLAEYRQLRDAA
ncbi:MAG: sigma-54-dependent Fis family transcriptional regulator [Planctomycetaceae bacterium]|nr:sigma-54-dependent Fis family transcriptional regulator [Planctomycetaceae bacterium]